MYHVGGDSRCNSSCFCCAQLQPGQLNEKKLTISITLGLSATVGACETLIMNG